MIEWTEIEGEQRAICKQINADWRAFDQSKFVAVNESIYNGSEPINGLRHPAQGTIDGWYIWCGGEIPQNKEDFFQPIHVEHLLVDLPECLKYLGLPYGWRFQIDRNGYEDIWYDPKLLQI